MEAQVPKKLGRHDEKAEAKQRIHHREQGLNGCAEPTALLGRLPADETACVCDASPYCDVEQENNAGFKRIDKRTGLV